MSAQTPRSYARLTSLLSSLHSLSQQPSLQYRIDCVSKALLVDRARSGSERQISQTTKLGDGGDAEMIIPFVHFRPVYTNHLISDIILHHMHCYAAAKWRRDSSIIICDCADDLDCIKVLSVLTVSSPRPHSTHSDMRHFMHNTFITLQKVYRPA